MLRLLAVLFAAVLLLGCSRSDEGKPADWSALGLQGKTLELIDSKKLEKFRFVEGGIAISSIGIKDEAVTAPAFYWKISAGTLIISVQPNSEVYEELSAPSIKEDIVTATRKSGVRARYKVST